ncbi:MAG: RluA family pseudouridine synthase [Pirellulales bacterium]|nr:RluA family pseudouridine synthase [Pirellulales bacterium]
MNIPFSVLYEDNHLLVVSKPPGLSTMGAKAGTTTLFSLAKEYIKRRYRKPGNVYLGVVSRLDRPVSGVVALARTSKAAARLAEQFRRRRVEKMYWALVEGRITPPTAVWEDFLRRDERRRRMQIVARGRSGAQAAVLQYRRLQWFADCSLVEIALQTGRKHQIRLQLAAHGHPVLGDRRYGSRRDFSPGIALHARQLVLRHPVRDERLTFTSPPPPSWQRFGVRVM